MSLSVAEFPAAFKAIHGHAPYLWQERLLRQVTERGWPKVIAAPTGAGKTAVLDIALFHLAMEARAESRRAPVRIVFAVDRRIIVDQAHERAKAIRNHLQAPTHPTLSAMSEALASFSCDRPLHVEALRGGMPREDDWAREPNQPTILCTTVDQLGSRLLFRGYGVSPSMAPIHAGLLGLDSLLILDEAHLSAAFAQTLASVARRQSAAERTLALPFAVTNLTATPGEADDVFVLTPEERDEPAIKARLTARKHATLREAKAKKAAGSNPPGSTLPEVKLDPPPDEEGRQHADPVRQAGGFAAAARDLVDRSRVGSLIAVVVNRVALARAIHGELAKDSNSDSILLTGRVRPVERDALMREYGGRLTGETAGEQPLFVVATQSIEAGADFDFDALVTQIAPLDSLTQRFGRLARNGERGGPAPAIIIATPEDLKAKDDPVYGDRMRLTWDWLQRWAKEAGERIDFGPDALAALIAADRDGAEACRSEAKAAPLLRAADVDFLAMTNPAPHPDPLLPLFLHGDPGIETDVSIVWRADLADDDFDAADGEPPRVIAIAAAMPPRPGEALSAPISAARNWLLRSAVDDVADAPQRAADGQDDSDGRARHKTARRVLRWRSKDAEIVGVGRIRPGDTLVVPSSYGGCDRFGWNPSSPDEVEDIADLAARPYRTRSFSVRMHSRVWPKGASLPTWKQVAAMLADTPQTRSSAQSFLEAVFEAEPDSDRNEAELSEELADLPMTRDASVQARVDALECLRAPRYRRLRLEWPYGETELDGAPVGAVFIAGKELVGSDDDDESSFLPLPQSLKDHVEAVESHTRGAAAALRLPAPVAEALRLAAHYHDGGKADERFQMLLGGEPLKEPLAKSGVNRSRREEQLARERAGFAAPWRHEALSVRLAMARFAAEPPGEVDLDLALWLIGSHHGQGRPFFRHDDPWDDHPRQFGDTLLASGPGPHRLDFEWAGQDWAGLFDTLRRRYGAWGLACLEATLRLADHRASEAAEKPDSED